MSRTIPIVIGLALVGLAILVLMMGTQRDEPLERSVLGSGGLAVWLQQKDIPVKRSHPRLKIDVKDLAFRFLPLKDTDFWETNKEIPERDLDWDTFHEKLAQLPTLVALPKWDDEAVLKDNTQPLKRLPEAALLRLNEQIGLGKTGFKTANGRFTEAKLSYGADKSQSFDVALYSAQAFDRATLPERCHEEVGIPLGALLIKCDEDDDYAAARFLSDPDLLNNHGLSLAQNADFAVALMKGLRGATETRPIYLDTQGDLLLDYYNVNDETETGKGRSYERSGTDLARFFTYPLSVFWALALVVTAIAFWRGSRRFGPPMRDEDDRLETSKTSAIEAKARLLRLTGNDGRMASEFARARLADLAGQTFGPAWANETGINRLFERVSRRDARLGQEFRAAAQALIERGAEMGQSDLHRALETFRDLFGRVVVGFK